MSREASIAKIIKDFGGVVRVCKNIALGHDDCGLSEHDLSAAIASYAKAKHPDLSEARAFTKVVTEGEDGLAFRKALDVVKQAGFVSLMPTFVRQDDAENHSGSSGNSASEALAKLAEEQRARAPWMTVAQAFSHVYLDPKNRHLAEAERAENRPQVR